ncbi:MAG: hypothetical protein Q8P53_02915 [Candidatus Shapirobacteria bacterium]|nr:hypothetical protein [Candidatus Shapirobacteria bacterium]
MFIKQFLHHLNHRDTKILTKPKIPRLSKFCLVFLVLISSIYLVKVIKAQNIIEQVQKAQTKGNNAESWHLNALETTATTLATSLSGKLEFNPDGSFKSSYLPGGAIGMTTNFIATLYNPPASGIEYIAQVKNQFLGGNPVYAQGAGFAGLQPILPLWRGFRNVVYVLSALVFVIIGLMIMFRVKVSPQAVINIQNAIPQIIITLILVTFSYAIAGLLIDISTFFQTMVMALLFQSYGQNGLLYHTGAINYNFSQLANPGFWNVFSLMNKAAPAGFLLLMSEVISLLMGLIIGITPAAIGGPAVGLVTVGIGLKFGFLGGIILFLIIGIIIFIWILKFFFGLIKVYVSLIIRIILAPLEIGMGAFPNSKIGFSSWLISVLADLSVFPISILFLVFANILIETSSQGLWRPSLLAFTAPFDLIGIAIGLATLMMLSQLPELIPQFVFQLKPSPLGNAVGESWKNMPFRGLASTIGGEVGYATGGAITEAIGNRLERRAGETIDRPAKKRPPLANEKRRPRRLFGW